MKTLFRSLMTIGIAGLIGLYVWVPRHVTAVTQFSSKLVTEQQKWSFEKSGSVETITKTVEGWSCQAGGVDAVTHYARIKYKVPEQSGVAPSVFYEKVTFVLPDDFYSKQTAGFRILNTDNYGTTVNGTHYGAESVDELRTGVHFYADHTIRLRSEHQNHEKLEFYKGTVPVGEHTFELFGDVANVSPWWFRIDGVTVASGNARLSPDSVPIGERVVTRFNAGIDGGSEYDTHSISVLVKDVTIANYDLTATGQASSTAPTVPSPTLPPAVHTSTPSPGPTAIPFTCPPSGQAFGSISFSVPIVAEDNYKLWVQMKGGGDSANAVYASIDSQYCAKVGDLAGMPAGVWTWVDYRNGSVNDKIPSSILSVGTHTVRLYTAERGVSVDRIILTKDFSCVPQGNGDACISFVRPTISPTPSAISATPSQTVPAITLNIAGGAQFSRGKIVRIVGTAKDPDGISQMVVIIDGKNKKTCTNISQCGYSWNTSGLAKRKHTIVVAAYDASAQRSFNAVSITVHVN